MEWFWTMADDKLQLVGSLTDQLSRSSPKKSTIVLHTHTTRCLTCRVFASAIHSVCLAADSKIYISVRSSVYNYHELEKINAFHSFSFYLSTLWQKYQSYSGYQKPSSKYMSLPDSRQVLIKWMADTKILQIKHLMVWITYIFINFVSVCILLMNQKVVWYTCWPSHMVPTWDFLGCCFCSRR